MLTFDANSKPDFVNELGVKWWIDKSSTNYARNPDFNDIVLDVVCYIVKFPNGKFERVIVQNGEIEFSSQKIEDIGCHIDIMKTQKAFDKRENKN